MQFRLNNRKPSPFQAIGGLLILAAFIIGMFLLARFFFRILAWLSPFLFIAALILDYRTVTGYFKWLFAQVKANPLTGILAIVLSVLGFPLLSAFLAGKAFLMRSVRKGRKGQEQDLEGEFADYETLDSETLDLPDRGEPIRKARSRESTPRKDPFDTLFDE